MNKILPTKHSHPDKTVIAVATIIIKRLKNIRFEQYDKLLEYVIKKNDDSKYLFLSALNFLYLFDVIEYHKKNDSFEYIGK